MRIFWSIVKNIVVLAIFYTFLGKAGSGPEKSLFSAIAMIYVVLDTNFMVVHSTLKSQFVAMSLELINMEERLNIPINEEAKNSLEKAFKKTQIDNIAILINGLTNAVIFFICLYTIWTATNY